MLGAYSCSSIDKPTMSPWISCFFFPPTDYCIDNDLEDFDSSFFEMTSADVQTLDPQQRQLLECCYEALECGGIPLNQVANTMTGVYIGNFASDYESLAFKEPEKIQGMQVLGMGRTTVSNRVSYLYNLNGPR